MLCFFSRTFSALIAAHSNFEIIIGVLHDLLYVSWTAEIRLPAAVLCHFLSLNEPQRLTRHKGRPAAGYLPSRAEPRVRSCASLSPFHREKSAVFQREQGSRSRPAPLWSSVAFIMLLMTEASDKETLWGFSS